MLLERALNGGRHRLVASRMPAWRIVVGRHGPVDWVAGGTSGRGLGLLVPPDATVDVMAASELVVLHLEAEQCGIGPIDAADFGIHPLLAAPADTGQLWAVADDHDLDTVTNGIVHELRARRVLPCGRLDPRVVAGTRALHGAEGVAGAAAQVGLSRSRFRALVQRQLGTSPARLRSWWRLRRAVAYLAIHGVAEAASLGGFADQPHLTRTASGWLATTPGRLRVQGRGRPAPLRVTTLPGPGASIPASTRG